MCPELLPGKRRERISCITDKASGGMSIKPKQERDEKVVRIPESLE